MTEGEFTSRIAQAEAMGALSDRPGYYEGYARGLTRRFRGPQFGNLQEHEQWLAFLNDWDRTKADRGRGYRDGLQGIRPRV